MDNIKLYVKEESNCRGDIRINFFTIPLTLIEEANSMKGKDDDEIEEWLEPQNSKYFTLLYGIITNPFVVDETFNCLEELEQKGGFIIELEEELYSVGKTKDLANKFFNEYQSIQDGWDDE